MLNETMEADREYQRALRDEYKRGYEKGRKDAQSEQRWIPCKERLPEEDGIYRVTIDPDYLTPDMVPTEDLYWHEGKWKYCDLVHHPNRMPELKLFELEATVLAWKPLEEPYKEQRG